MPALLGSPVQFPPYSVVAPCHGSLARSGGQGTLQRVGNLGLRYYHRRGALCDLNMTGQVRLATGPVRCGFAVKTDSYPSIPRGLLTCWSYRQFGDCGSEFAVPRCLLIVSVNS